MSSDILNSITGDGNIKDSRLVRMNILYLQDDTLYFHGFSKLQKTVAILYSKDTGPAVIAPGKTILLLFHLRLRTILVRRQISLNTLRKKEQSGMRL